MDHRGGSTPNRTTDTTAILSICFSVGGLIFGPLAILGIIFGHVAKSKMRQFPEIGGRGLATAGLVVGYLLVAFWLIGFIFFGMFSLAMLAGGA